MKLAIVMPAYNEAECIETVVREWTGVFGSGIAGKLLVINDGSRDQTAQILDRLAASEPRLMVIHQANAGHGAAVLRGYQEALALNPEYVFQTDSDDQFKARDFQKVWEKRKESPFVTGFRKARSDAFHRLVITKIMLTLNWMLFGAFLRDANVPYRLMKADYLRELLQLFPNTVFAPNIFLAVLAKKTGATLFEIPIGHEERKTGQVSIIKWKLVKVCFRCVRELISFRLSMLLNAKTLRQISAKYA